MPTGTPPIPLEQGLVTLEICLAAKRSLMSGQPQRLS
jgi:hypothetical protein